MLSENEQQIKEGMVSDLYNKAKSAFELDNFGYAITLFRNVLAIYPEFSQARHLYHLAIIHDQELHRNVWYKSISQFPIFLYHIMKGWVYSTFLNKHLQAIFDYERAFELNPSSKWPLFQIALLSEKCGMDETTIIVFEELTGFNYNLFLCHKNLALIHLRRNELRSAQTHIDKATSLNPDDKDVIRALKDLAALGTIEHGFWEGEGDFTEKLKDKELTEKLKKVQSKFDKTTREDIEQSEAERAKEIEAILAQLQSNPADINLLQKARSMHLTQSMTLMLIQNYEKLIANSEPHVASFYFLGDLYHTAQFWSEAEQAYRKAYECDSLDETLIRALECQLIQIEKPMKSGLTESTPTNAQLLKTKQLDLKKEILERKLNIHPNDTDLHFQLGKIFSVRKQYDLAIEKFQKTLDSPKLRTVSLIGMGECFMHKNLLDLAIEQFEKALERVPTMDATKKHILYQISSINMTLNNLDKAKVYFKQIYEVDIAYKDVAQKLEALYKSSS